MKQLDDGTHDTFNFSAATEIARASRLLRPSQQVSLKHSQEFQAGMKRKILTLFSRQWHFAQQLIQRSLVETDRSRHFKQDAIATMQPWRILHS